MTDCKYCQHAKEHGWWGDSTITHCRTCHFTWNINTQLGHCEYCHRSFKSPSTYDLHLKTGTDGRSIFHLDPHVKNQVFYQDEKGVWRKQDQRYAQDAGEPVSEPPPASSNAFQGSEVIPPSPGALSWIPNQRKP